MSSANMDLVRSIYADWESGDFSSAHWAHPELEFVFGVDGGVLPGSRRGPAGMAEAYRDWLSAWEDSRVEGEEYRELDDERILVLDSISGRGKRSGLEFGQLRPKSATLFHVREGKVTRLVLYGHRDRAFADLGLGPEGAANGPD